MRRPVHLQLPEDLQTLRVLSAGGRELADVVGNGRQIAQRYGNAMTVVELAVNRQALFLQRPRPLVLILFLCDDPEQTQRVGDAPPIPQRTADRERSLE